MAKPPYTGDQNTYAICVKGILDQRWSDWFDGFTITYPSDDESLLTGNVVDQAALHGLLSALRDMNLPLISVYRIGHHQKNKDQLGGKSLSSDQR